MVVTVSGMSAQEHDQVGHASYIAAVRHRIEASDIRVTAMTVTTSADSRREATLTLRPDASAFAAQVPAEASVSWDENNGWSMRVRNGQLANDVCKGLEMLPDPADVAAWAVTLLAHPELTPSYEDHPFRDHRVHDPGFEARLATYAPGG
jgi:hypothetical protein